MSITATIIALGTRGDVQPAIALGKALKQQAGHHVRILASRRFQDWITVHGLEAVPSNIDIQAIMTSEGGKDWVENGLKPLSQLRIMRQLLNQYGLEMCLASWQACQGSDFIISSFTSDAFAVAIAEKLGLKLASMPLQPSLIASRDGQVLYNAPFPNRLSVFNYLFAKLLIEPGGWRLYGNVVNQFRQKVLGLPAQTGKQNLQARQQLLVLHGYSPKVVPQPADWPPNFHTVGYWFLESDPGWQPPPELEAFLQAGSKPIAIGFGSMTGRNSERISQIVMDAIEMVGCRAILLAGWAGIGDGNLPESVLRLDAVPHDWLFPRMAAVIHHGGAGTTAAGLRAGVPSILVPHFVDQPFWGQRVSTLGIGPKHILRTQLSAKRLAEAIQIALTDQAMQEQAAAMGRTIRAEDGLGQAVRLIEAYLSSFAGTY